MGRPPQQLKTSPLGAFSPENFSKLLQGRGLSYRWSRALVCSCRLNSVTAQWDPTCPRCDGSGYVYVSPCAYEERHLTAEYIEVKAVFSNVAIDTDEADTAPSPYSRGKAQLTVQGEMRVGWRDRFVGIEQEMAFSELLVRGATAEVPVGRTGLTRDEKATAMRYEPVAINYIEQYLDGSLTVYYPGIDFELKGGYGSVPNRLKWFDGQGPDEGTHYAVHYVIHPVWVVDQSTYNIQNSVGPAAGLKGSDVTQYLPTTFAVKLDYITPERV